MVRAATEGQPGFTVDDREIRREGLSYSVDTMRTLRADFPDRSLCLIVGMDAFLGLPKWREWRELLELSHLVVAHRPGWRAPSMGPLGELLVDRGTGRIGDLHEARAGCIYIHVISCPIPCARSSSRPGVIERRGDQAWRQVLKR